MPQANSEKPYRGLVRIYMLGAVPARPRAEMGGTHREWVPYAVQ